MANWKYTLKNGKALKRAIDNEDLTAILDCLARCFREINKNFPDEYDEYELEEDLEDIANQKDNVQNYRNYGMTYDEVIDSIDFLLDGLYDLCDGLRIWIDI